MFSQHGIFCLICPPLLTYTSPSHFSMPLFICGYYKTSWPFSHYYLFLEHFNCFILPFKILYLFYFWRHACLLLFKDKECKEGLFPPGPLDCIGSALGNMDFLQKQQPSSSGSCEHLWKVQSPRARVPSCFPRSMAISGAILFQVPSLRAALKFPLGVVFIWSKCC